MSQFPVVSTELRVRYAETDAMGIAHHTAYLVWFETGRTEYTRAMGLPYRQLEEAGTRLVVIEVRCRYHQPARYDDELMVSTTVRELTGATVTFAYEIRRKEDDTILVEGSTVHAATTTAGRVRRIPDALQAALTGVGRKGTASHE